MGWPCRTVDPMGHAVRSRLDRLPHGLAPVLDQLARRRLRADRHRVVYAVAGGLGAGAEPGAGVRRSHGSLYKALARGEVDDEAMRELLVEHRPSGWPLVFAVDASTWPRCDAETSPERGYYYSASKHSAGQPIVAGWSYQWISQLDWAADSWTAPMDARRIPVGSDTTTVTVAQVSDLTRRLHHPRICPARQRPHRRSDPHFVFDAGYDPIALTHDSAISPRRSWSGSAMTGSSIPTPHRPSRHDRPSPPPRRPVQLRDPPTWPAPDTELHARTPATAPCTSKPGAACTQTRRTRTVDRPRRPADRDRNRHPRRRRTPTQTHLTHQKDAVAVGVRPGPDRPRTCWRAYLRRFDIEHTFRFCKNTLGWTTPDCAPPNKPTGGPGSSPPPTPNFGSPDPWSPTSDCPGKNPPNQANSPPLVSGAGFDDLPQPSAHPPTHQNPAKQAPDARKGPAEPPNPPPSDQENRQDGEPGLIAS